jgi:predicted TPR repeat methyltransferase
MNRKQRRITSKRGGAEELFLLAESLNLKGRIGEAEDNYRKAVALKPGFAEAHTNLAAILRNTNRFAEAERHFFLAVKYKPDALSYTNLANILLLQGQFTEATAIYRGALSLQPLFAEAHNGLATALRHLGDFREAESHCARALEINPNHWNARIGLGLALVEQGRIAEVVDHVELLSRSSAHPGFPYRSFGMLLARAGWPDEAKICFERHLAKYPDDADDIALLLASMGAGALPGRASKGLLVGMYASRAKHWDQGASGPTGYQGARLVATATENLTAGTSGGDVIDAGCGTGLIGELLRGKARTLVGIDMSAPMLQQAEQKKIYNELHQGDLVEFLNNRPSSCDVIASAATLIHFGELDSVFRAAAKSLRPQGLFVFTVFPNDEKPEEVAAETLDGYGQGGCFRHGQLYVARTAAEAGFTVELMELAAHEYVRQQPKMGLVVALRVTGRAQQNTLAA